MVHSLLDEEAILKENMFVELIVPTMGVKRKLSPDEMDQF